MIASISFIATLPNLLIATFVFFIIYLVLVPYLKLRSRKQAGVITNFFPLIGILRYWMKSAERTNDVMGDSKDSFQQFPNHKVMMTNFGTSPALILRDPQYIKEFLLNTHLYQKSSYMDFIKVLIGNGLVAAEGETWKRHRRIISSSFHFDFLKDNISVIQKTAREFLDKLTRHDKIEYLAIRKLQEITGEIVGRIFFGENLNNYSFEGKSLCRALADITWQLSESSKSLFSILFGARVLKYPILPKFKKVMTRVKKFRGMCLKIIEDRKTKLEQSTGNDLLASLLVTQKLNDLDKKFSDEEIVDEFLTFFIAGMDTTGHLLGMTLYNLTQYPQYIEQLRQERNTYYNCESIITGEALQKMDVLQSFLKESLRFYTPGPFTFLREALVDHNILDLPVKKGDLIAPEFLAAAFDERNFEEPKKFSPERWRTAETGKVDPYAFIPFSAGPRNCIGQHLAMIEAKIIMSEFLERFEFKLKEGYKLKMVVGFLYEPETDIKLKLTPIRSN